MPFRKSKPFGQQKPPPGSPIDFGDPLSVGLRGAYLFNENGGLKLTSASQIAPAFAITAATWTTNGGLLNFNGTTAKAVQPDATRFVFDYLQPFSVQCRFITTNDALEQSLIGNLTPASNYIGWELSVRTIGIGLGAIQFFLINTYPTNAIHVHTTAGTIVSNVPYVVTATYSGGTSATAVNVYINGISRSLNTLFSPVSATTVSATPTQIGQRSDATDAFVGLMDGVSLWNRELKPGEVMARSRRDKLDYSHVLAPRRRIVSQVTAAAANTKRSYGIFIG